MYKIQLLNTISQTGLAQFPSSTYQLSPTEAAPDAILVRSQDMHTLTLPDSVKAIGRAGAGTNNIPIPALTKRGILVMNTPGANANAVRELVLAGMLLCSRHICEAWDYVKHLNVNEADLDATIEQNKKQFAGYELLGKTLAVIGLGSVGVKVANAAVHLGMQVIGYDPTISVNRAWELSSSVVQARSLEEALSKADFITLHVPLVPDTKHLINAARLQQIQSGAALLNFSRDAIVDNEAVLVALNNKQLSAYISDFPSAALKNHERVISLPHLGASTREAEENCAIMIVKQLRDYLEIGSISNSVNLPNVDAPAPAAGATRLALVNNNVPNMVAQISSTLGSAGINIISLLNKSRDDIAYTLIDISSEVSPQVLTELAAIKGILQVRKIC